MTKKIQQQRIRKIQRRLAAASKDSALLLSTSTERYLSRDQIQQYRQASDFFYLTGEAQLQNTLLLLTSKSATPVILSAPEDPQKQIWDGPTSSAKLLAKHLGAEPVVTKSFESEVLSRLKGLHTLYYQSEPGSLGLQIARKLFDLPPHQRSAYPNCFIHSDDVLEPLRLFKEADEIALIEEANKITNLALLCVVPLLRAGKTEDAIAATIDYSFRVQGAENAFSSIVASGKNAATLHHRAGASKLKNGELVLIDIGARYQGYCADISRTVPLGGKCSEEVHQDLYDVVLAAQKAALSKVKAGVTAKVPYDAAVKELAAGLKENKIIKKPISEIINKRLYLPYFPHGIGHTLGIDIHDIGNLRGNTAATLEEGMVITIEPGLYLSKSIGKIKPVGIRIEDNLQVTRSGYRLLSEGFPKDFKAVTALFS